MLKKFAVLGTCALAGCNGGFGGNTGGGGNLGGSGADTCNAAAYQQFVGQDSVVTLSIPEPKRSYRTDEAVPSEFNAQRVNILLDETDTIIAIACG